MHGSNDMSTAILLTTDFSECARSAYPFAARLAHALDLPIRLTHVIDTDSPIPEYPEGAHVALPTWKLAIAEAVQHSLAKDAAALAAYDVLVEVHYRSGVPEYQLQTELAKDCAAVVLATHGYRGFRRAVLGSVTARLIEASNVSLLIVGKDMVDRPINRVLVPRIEGLGADDLTQPLFLAARLGSEAVHDSLLATVSDIESGGTRRGVAQRLADRAGDTQADLIAIPACTGNEDQRSALRALCAEAIARITVPLFITA